MASFTIGQLSRRTGVNIETIRYFEKVGLVASPPRTEGGHRIYGDDHLRALEFIRRARELGFTPDEVRGILRELHHWLRRDQYGRQVPKSC